MEAKNRLIQITYRVIPGSFINHNQELIVVPTHNVYLCIDNAKTERELTYKVISWLSRPSCKGISDYYQKRVRTIFNEFLGTNFTKEEISDIYTVLGNELHRDIGEEFISSGYDVSLLRAFIDNNMKKRSH